MTRLSSPVRVPGLAPSIGSYAPAVTASLGDGGRLVWVSGQVASDENGRTVGLGDPGAQTRQVFANMARVLAAAGGTLLDLVSVVIYVTDMADFAAVSGVRNQCLGGSSPSSTFVAVSALAIPEHLVEISGIAVVPSRAEV